MPANNIFIVYSVQDKLKANEFVSAVYKTDIKGEGVFSFYQHQHDQPRPSAINRIKEDISSSSAMILLLSKYSVKSDFVSYEYSLAREANIPVIIVFLSPYESESESEQYLEFARKADWLIDYYYSDPERAIVYLLSILKELESKGKKLKQNLLKAAVPTAFGVIITVSAAFPAIGVVLLAPLLLLNQTQSSLSNASISIEDRQSPGVVRHGEIDIQIPLIMKVSRDERVHVRFNTGSEQIREPSWVPKAKLEGNTFTIKPVNFEGVSTKSNYDWDWNVTPTKPGDRLLTFLVEPSVQLTLKGDIKDFSIDNGKLFAKIDVRDEIGLKPWQRGTAIAIGGVLTLIGTIAGYSFLKRYLERPVPTLASQPSLPPASSQAGLPPVPKISSKTRPSQRNHRSKGK